MGNERNLFANSTITNLVEILQRYNVSLDLSKATYLGNFLANSTITDIGVIDGSALSDGGAILYNARKLKNVELLKINTRNIPNPNAFAYCDSLKEIRFEGYWGKSTSLQWSSKLSAESAKSLFGILVDYSGTTTTYTITLHANAKARLTESDIAIATQKGWTVA